MTKMSSIKNNKKQHNNPSILMVSYNAPPFVFAGAGNQAKLLSNHLIQQGVSVQLLTSVPNQKELFKTSIVDNVPIIQLKGTKNNVFRLILFTFLSVIFFVKESFRFNIIHIHGCTHLTTMVWIVLALVFNTKSVYKATCNDVDTLSAIKAYPCLGKFALMLLKKVSIFIAITPQIANDFEKHVPSEKILLIPNSCDGKKFLPLYSQNEKSLIRDSLNLPKNKLILIYSGGINPRKNIGFLIESLSALIKINSDIYLLLVGPCKKKYSSYKEELIKRIGQLNLSSDIRFEGEIDYSSISKYLQAADIFVFSSLKEGFPSVLIEAAACGLPIVSTNIPGVTDYILKQNMDFSKIIDHSVTSMAAAVQELAINKNTMPLTENSRKYFEKNYDLGFISSEYMKKVYSC